jgi:hypothetical protein
MAKSNLKRAYAAGKPDIADLSFIGTRKPTKDNIAKRDFWVIPETGDYGVDNGIGHRAAFELVEYMKSAGDGSQFMLGSVVESMIEKGRFGGVEVGFLQVFGELAAKAVGGQH